ncbi:hypothetical protein F5146DRAFT_124805 [Armillaria mellea]|nr:hypothetical protein F5146DRAFT_124805 [Armillaria mellea]
MSELEGQKCTSRRRKCGKGHCNLYEWLLFLALSRTRNSNQRSGLMRPLHHFLLKYGSLLHCHKFATTTVMSTARVRLLSRCWYFAGAYLYFLEILHYLGILPQTVLVTQERVVSIVLSTGAITGIAVFTTLVPLMFLLALIKQRREVWRIIWTDILDKFPPQPTFFVGLIVNDAVYQRVAGTSVLEGGSARIGLLIVQLWAYIKYIGVPLAGSVGFTAYSIVREQAKEADKALMKM